LYSNSINNQQTIPPPSNHLSIPCPSKHQLKHQKSKAAKKSWHPNRTGVIFQTKQAGIFMIPSPKKHSYLNSVPIPHDKEKRCIETPKGILQGNKKVKRACNACKTIRERGCPH
jgi:hypothetical protein